MKQTNYIQAGLGLLGLGMLVLAPLFTRNIFPLFYVMFYITIAQSLNILYGYTGYMPFGIVSFCGIGGYATALMLGNYNIPIPLALLASGAASGALGLLLSPALRLRGIYFALVSYAAAEALRVLFIYLPESFSGGLDGIFLPRYYSPDLSYYVMLVVMVFSVLIIWRIEGSKLSLILKSIKEDTELAEVIGINTNKYKIIAWMIASFLPGIAGGTLLLQSAIIYPRGAFDHNVSIFALVFVIFGGAGTVAGPVLGCLLLYALNYYVMFSFPMISTMVFGLLLTLTTLVAPQGVMGLTKNVRARTLIKKITSRSG